MNFENCDQRFMRVKTAIPYLVIGFILISVIVVLPIVYSNLIPFVKKIDSPVSSVVMDCANNYSKYVIHAYECSKFSSGSLAELCVLNYKSFNPAFTSVKDCSIYIPPGN